MDALVTDADVVGAVAGLRGLAAGGVRAVAVGTRPWDAALWSRDAAARALAPGAELDPAGFTARLGALAAERGGAVVYPSREESLDALLAPGLPGALRLPFGDVAGVDALRDKQRLPELAAAAGLRVPATLAEGPAGSVDEAGVATPVMVKPLRRGPGLPEVTRATTPAELRAQLAALPAAEPVVLQEVAEGPLVMLAVVVDREGEVVARFQQRALRIWPPGGGACSLAVSEPPDEELCAGAARLLREAGHHGLAQLDVLATPEGPRLIDVNPRYYLSMGLALACGVNLPAAWHAVVTGATPPAQPPRYPAGVTYRRLESDFTAAVNGHPRLLLARGAAPRTGAVWSARDPLPGAAAALERVGGFAARRLRRAG